MLEKLLPRFSEYGLVEPVEWTRSNHHIGIHHMIVELRRPSGG